MTVADSPAPPAPPLFRYTCLAAWFWLTLIYLCSIVQFLVFTSGQQNEFAKLAREKFVVTIALMTLKLYLGYLILAVLLALASYPLIVARHRRRPFARWGVAWRTFLCLLLLLVLSLGFLAPQNPGVIDSIGRFVHRFIPGSDVWAVLRKLPWLLGGLGLLWLLWNVRFYARLRPGRWGMAALILPLSIYGSAPLWQSSSAQPQDPTRPNILIIASDSLRADHLGLYGYARETSPVIDRLGAESVVFDEMFVPTGSTMESWLSLLSAQWPHTHGIRYMFPNKQRVERAGRNPDLLTRILARRGYRTGVISNWAGNCFATVDMGFEQRLTSDTQNFQVFLAEAQFKQHWIIPYFFNNRLGRRLFPQINNFSTLLNPERMDDDVVRFMEQSRHSGQPFMATVFYSSTHLPFIASWPFNTRFVDPGYDGPNRSRIDFGVDQFIQHGFRNDLTAEQRQHITNLYDGCVAEFDYRTGKLLDYLKRTGLDRNTIVVVTSDHGDDLFDPGTTLGHGVGFSGGDHVNRIPMIIRFPDRRWAGKRIRRLTRSIDWAPTLLETLGIRRPASYEGVSLLPYLEGKPRDLGLLAYGETCYLFYPKKLAGDEKPYYEAPADRTLKVDPSFDHMLVLKDKYHDYVIRTKDRCLWTERWKLIYIPGRDGPIYRLYDRLNDPQNLKDLSAENRPIFSRLRDILQDWIQQRKERRWK